MESEGKGRKHTIDVLMEGPGGELVFTPIKASKDDLRELVQASKNPVLSHNLFREIKEKRIKGIVDEQ